MRYQRLSKILIILAICLTTWVSCSKGQINADEKSNVQIAMKEFVDAKLAQHNNIYDIEDLKGEFDYLHDGVKRNGDLYVSCADVKVGSDVYDIDYHVKKEKGQYIVLREVLHKINKEKINRTLWEKE